MYLVVFGLLSASVAMVAMDSPLSKSREIAKDLSQEHHHLNLADIKKEILEDAEKVEKVVHNVEKVIHDAIHKGVEVLKEEDPVIISALNTIGVKNAANIVHAIENTLDTVEKVDDEVDSLVQKLEEANIAKNEQNVEDALKK